MSKIPSANEAVVSGGHDHNMAAAAPRSKMVVDAKKAAAGMRIAADAIERGDVSLTALEQSDSQHAAIASLGRAAIAVGEMKSDQSFGWAMRDNNPNN